MNDIIEKYQEYVMTGFVKAVQPIVIERASGAVVTSDEGKDYVDCFAGIAVVNRQPRSQAVAIAGGRFLTVGTNDEIRPLGDARTRRVDLAGETVVPGFIDAHSHPAVSGRLHLREVDCDLRSIERDSSRDC